MIFWRILDSTLYPIQEVKKLGFEKSEGLRIPDEYLEQQEFTVLRTAWGIGDWGIISAMPRLLKEKYPNCKVYIPSKKLIKELFNVDTNVMYDRVKLNGWNLGYYNPNYLNFDNSNLERTIDVCAIYQGFHKENDDHGTRNDILYTNHRTKAWEILESSNNISYEKDKRPFPEFANIMRKSKCTLSPFGMGEICFRDFEIIQFGSVMIKPDMSKVITHPNIYIPYETYIPCKLDWSDLIEKIEWVKSNPKQCKEITENARQVFKESYTTENLLLHWYNIISTFNGIEI